MIWIPFITLLVLIGLLFIATLRRLDITPSATLIGLAILLLSAALTGDMLAIALPIFDADPRERSKVISCFGTITGPLSGLGVLTLAISIFRLARMASMRRESNGIEPEPRRRFPEEGIKAAP